MRISHRPRSRPRSAIWRIPPWETYARVVPMIAFQGDADTVVAPMNVERLVHESLTTDDLADDGIANGSVPQTPQSTSQGSATGGHAYSIDHYVDNRGQPLIERWLIAGLVHAWPGGAAGVEFTDPMGPSATAESYRFFRSIPCRHDAPRLERRASSLTENDDQHSAEFLRMTARLSH